MTRSARWLILAAAALAATAASAPARAEVGCCSAGAERGGGPELFGPIPLRLVTPENHTFSPARIVVIASNGAAVEARAPREVEVYGAPRLNLSGAPLVGGLFGDAPASDAESSGARIGPAYRAGDALVVVAAETAPALPPLGIAPNGVATTRFLSVVGTGRRIVETGADLRFGQSAFNWRTPPPGAEPIGVAYAQQGRLVVTPPPRSQSGFDLF